MIIIIIIMLWNQGVHREKLWQIGQIKHVIKNKTENLQKTQRMWNLKYRYKIIPVTKWSHQNRNEWYNEKFRSHTRKTCDRFTRKESYLRNITHNTESTAV
jgi:hypothetical protein